MDLTRIAALITICGGVCVTVAAWLVSEALGLATLGVLLLSAGVSSLRGEA